MCFSANASFGTGIILGVIGVVSIKKARSFPMQLFAAIPLIFSIQQFTEGFAWLSFTNRDYGTARQLFTHIFLVFAYVVWPVWIPMCIMLMETDGRRNRVILFLLTTGILISFYIGYCLLLYPVYASVRGQHIIYTLQFPHVRNGLNWISDLFYFVATIPALFISTVKRMWLFGVILVAAYIVSRLFFHGAVISVWCYFSAALSGVVFLIVMGSRNLSAVYKNQVPA